MRTGLAEEEGDQEASDKSCSSSFDVSIVTKFNDDHNNWQAQESG